MKIQTILLQTISLALVTASFTACDSGTSKQKQGSGKQQSLKNNPSVKNALVDTAMVYDSIQRKIMEENCTACGRG